MNTDTNQHYDAPPLTTVFTPDFDVGSSGSSLLDQMERAFTTPVMQLHAMEAARLLAGFTDESPEQLEEHIKRLSRLSLVQKINHSDSESMTLAVSAAAVMTVSRQGRQTAIQKLEGAMAILSKLYQADW